MNKKMVYQKFRTERELVRSVESVGIGTLLQKRKHQIFAVSEFEGTHGIADLVFFEMSSTWNSELNVGEISPSWTYVFSKLSNSSFPVEKLIKLSGCNTSYAKKVLKDLEEKDLLEKLENGRWKLKKKVRPITRSIISIECKLKNWRRALSQAIRYQDYSHQSWVVLDYGWCSNITKNIDEFKKHNIGLALIDPSNKISILYRPKKSKPKHLSSFWFANSKAAKEIYSSYSAKYSL